MSAERDELMETIASRFDELIGKGSSTDLAEDAADEILALGYTKVFQSGNNPIVTLHVTERELAVLSGRLGYRTPHVALRDKMGAAAVEMKLAKRRKNRERKMARKAKVGQ